ncbi:hypothetical protein PVAP13_5KG123700 [Panicum virgatum]|uniref:Uncharacterized protein n=1 Tax=Panicum virgatum TaxID=38727 RepID=A0A8T0SBP0_PANVG|nr:hypothetical protein PVAP13_5KG123700 [Panicum virgatum]
MALPFESGTVFGSGSITDVRAEVELGDMASVSMKSIAGS